MDDVTPGRQFLHIGPEGDGVEVNAVRLWESQWVSAGGGITVAHPRYPYQSHVMTTYRIDGAETEVNFAAGEFLNGSCGFYVPEDHQTQEPTTSGWPPCGLPLSVLPRAFPEDHPSPKAASLKGATMPEQANPERETCATGGHARRSNL